MSSPTKIKCKAKAIQPALDQMLRFRPSCEPEFEELLVAQLLRVRRGALIVVVLTLACFFSGSTFAQIGPGKQLWVSPLSKTDVSPDAPFGQTETTDDPGGRIVSIVADPLHDGTLYAASEMAGVWKTVDGGVHWVESNIGLRNGISVQHRQTLSLDDQNPARLMYLSQDSDGRVRNSVGGLWVSTDGAGSWQHVYLPNCPSPNLLGSGFTTGKAFVATRCGIATSADPSLASSTWTFLSGTPFPNFNYTFSVRANSQSLFACQGNKLYRSLSLGSPGSWTSTTLPGGCFALAISPDDDKKVVVSHLLPAAGQMGVSVFDLDAAGQNFQSIGDSLPAGGSGAAGVFVVRRDDGSTVQGPGLTYDVFAATGLTFYHYVVRQDTHVGSWVPIPNVHDDTWAMAFSPEYSPANFRCPVYLSTDGGVFIQNFNCDLSTNWTRAMSGLHVMYSSVIGGISRPASACGGAAPPCPTLYYPTGDNDVWVTQTGGIPNDGWKYFGSALGDAAMALVDPALPSAVVVARNQTYELATSSDGNPPTPSASFQNITPPMPSDGGAPPSLGNLAQVLTLPGEAAPSAPDIVAVESPAANKPDVIVRNMNGSWIDVSPDDEFSFGHGQVGAIGVSGGHEHPTIYVLTSPNADYSIPPVYYGPGEIWKGVAGYLKLRWTKASEGISAAYDLFVDPYDPNVAYVTDLGDWTIKETNDGGASWHVSQDLTAYATNFGEFDFDCGNPGKASGPIRTSSLAWSCPLQQVIFDRDHPNVRIAALWFGGVFFSRDNGSHWIPLLVTNNGVFDNGPPEFPFSMFYDSQVNPVTGNPSLYIALLGKSIRRVGGPLLAVAAPRIEICQFCAKGLFNFLLGVSAKNLALFLEGDHGGWVPLILGKDGSFHGSFLIDATQSVSFSYRLVVDGKEMPRVTYALTDKDKAAGVVPIEITAEDEWLEIIGWLASLLVLAGLVWLLRYWFNKRSRVRHIRLSPSG